VSERKKILVLRFSALGDVAMSAPVIWALTKVYPDHEIVFVSRPFAREIFAPINRVTFIGADFNNKHKGLIGLFRLFKLITKHGSFEYVADLHGVTRSFILGTLFRLNGSRVFTIDKGRGEKKALCARHDKRLVQLKSTFERYRGVFQKAGAGIFPVDFPGKMLYNPSSAGLPHEGLALQGNKIGIAPFAKHKWKAWPAGRMVELIERLTRKGYVLFLFGSKGEEQKVMESWASGKTNVFNLAGQFSISNELKVMANLDLMISMDSANMHLASLSGIPVLSIWGATHPNAGFYGWGQDINNAVQVNLDCRPCSVYGNKKCYRGDFACMESITPDMVEEKIDSIINQHS